MTTRVQAVKRSLVSLKLERPTAKLITQATALVSSMTNNANFATPSPPLATVTAAITALQTAETAVKARTHGAVASRNEKQKALTTLLGQTKSYIQSVADSNSDTAETVIKSAGVAVRAAAIRQKQVFAVAPGPVSGSVKLTAAAAGDRASYEWQYSLDGKTWQTMPTTLQAKSSIQGLTVGASVLFRSRAVTRAGEGNWTQGLAITVT